jgi:hypothetical protein
MSIKDEIEEDITYMLGLWKLYSIISDTNTATLCDTFNVSIDILDEECIDILDKSTNLIYTYDVQQEEFISDEGGYVKATDHISKFIALYQSGVDSLYTSIENICENIGYSVDFDDGLMYAYSDDCVITMPYWCTDRTEVDCDRLP